MTTVTGPVGETLQELESDLQRKTKQAVQVAKERAKHQRRLEQHRLAGQREQLKRDREEWETQHAEAVQALEDLTARKVRKVEELEQEAAADRAQAATILAHAQQTADLAAAQRVAADQASKGADLKLLSAKRQLAQMVLWGGSLAYAIWIMHGQKLFGSMSTA